MNKNDFTRFNTNKGDDRENTVVNFSINSNSPFPIGLLVISKIRYKYENVHRLVFVNQYACGIFNITPTIKIDKLRDIFNQYKILGFKNELGATLDSILFDEKIINEYCATFLNSTSMVYIKFRRYKDSIYLIAELYNEERKNIQKKLFTSLKYQYLATLYHELNNPLNALLSMTEEQSRIIDEEQEDNNKSLLNIDNAESLINKKRLRFSKSLSVDDTNNDDVNIGNRSYNGDIDINANNIFKTMYEKEKQIFILTRLIKTFSTNFLFYLKLNLNVDEEDGRSSVIGAKLKTTDIKTLKNGKNNSSNYLIGPAINDNKEMKTENSSNNNNYYGKGNSAGKNIVNIKHEMKLNLEYLFKNFLEEFNCLFEYKDIQYDINFDILSNKYIVTDEQRSYYFIRQIYTYLYYIIPRQSFFSIIINLIKIDTIKIIFKKTNQVKKKSKKCKKKLSNIDPAFMKEFNVAKTVKTQEITREILYSLSELLHFNLKIGEEIDDKYLTLIIPNVTLEELSDVDEEDIDEVPKNQKNNNILQNIDDIMARDINVGTLTEGSCIYNGSTFSHDNHHQRNSLYSNNQKYNSSFSNDKFKNRRVCPQFNRMMVSPKMKRSREQTRTPGLMLGYKDESNILEFCSSCNNRQLKANNHSQRKATLFKKQSLENGKLTNQEENNNRVNTFNYCNSTSKKNNVYKILVNGNENYRQPTIEKSSSNVLDSSFVSGQIVTKGDENTPTNNILNKKKSEGEIHCLKTIQENPEPNTNEQKINAKNTFVSFETGEFGEKNVQVHNNKAFWNPNELNNIETPVNNNHSKNKNNNKIPISNDNIKKTSKTKNVNHQKKSGYYQSKLMSYGVEILYEDCHNSEPKNKNNLENININEHKINFYSKNNSLNNNSAGSSIKAKNDSENSDDNSDLDLNPVNNISNNNNNINSENSSTSIIKIKDANDKLNFSFGLSPSNSAQSKNYLSINNNLNMKKIPSSNTNKIQIKDLSAISESSEDLDIYASNVCNCNCNDVMVVDDEIFNVKTAQNVFKKIDLNTDVAYNGQECIDLIKKKKSLNCKCSRSKYKIIFMDIMMPVLDGIAAAKEIQSMIDNKEINEIVIIFVSTYSSMNLKAQVKEIVCAKEYLAKPVPLSKYKEVLNKYYFPQNTE